MFLYILYLYLIKSKILNIFNYIRDVRMYIMTLKLI